MIKLFVSDLDGTMFHQGQLFEHDVEALKNLIDQGVILCFASGRLDYEIVKIMESLGNNFHRISMNGTYIYSNEGEALLDATFHPSVIDKVYEMITHDKFLIYVADNSTYYIEEKTDLVKEIEKNSSMNAVELKTLKSDLGKSITPKKYVVLGEDEDLLELQKELQEELPEYVTSFISAKNCLDIVPVNVSKGSAIQILIEKLGIKSNEIACIGDAYNDISMFELTPNSFAMENADDEVKKYASYTVPSVAEAVKIVLQMK
ncbi:HAD family hydrolase [Bacillus sp. AFS002410]|uniref:Cof-type HAD-IIB family hydrolase n=1 Tax=Bacillus sp. AFS002410 TaxID=2033481 RepID=UPI000BF15ACE|nr:Cof-type HAD-IIB family hydrolase [Bacillus sp. AFS002410]PEJ56219.1 HAD family hydrolase [Bacillus sp. AFS002410]